MGFGDGFNPSKSDVASSTKSGGSLTQTHQFTGSVFITSSATSLSASNSISASAFIGDGSGLTNLPGGGGAGIAFDGSTANGVATYKSATTASVESNFTFDGAANLLSVTGSLSISGAFGIQLSKSSDATINLDSTTDYYVVCTRDGAVTVNLPAAASAIQGSMFIIKDGLGTNRASGGKEIAVSSSGDASDVIDGATGLGGYGSRLEINNPFGADQFISDGVNTWYSY